MEKREIMAVDKVKYTPEELEQRSSFIRMCNSARDQKLKSWGELDDMDYETWYWKGKKASEGYIEPRKNKEDVRIVTGTTREKVNTLVSNLLNYNLECDITAYDEESLVDEELGQAMELMVRKSRDLESPDYEQKRALYYKEIVSVGNVFAWEKWLEVEDRSYANDLKWNEGEDPSKFDWGEEIKTVVGACDSELLTGINVYPGNMRCFNMERQPYVVLKSVYTYAEAESKYVNWSRFKYVPKKVVKATDISAGDNFYEDYSMIENEVDQVEELIVMIKYGENRNRMMIMLNGVMMLPINFPLSSLLGKNEYPIAKGDGEMISPNFFFSRGVGMKTRVDQAILDETMTLMINKDRRSYKPPMADNGNFNLSQDIFLPGKIIKGADADKIKPIGDNSGITGPEFNFFSLMKGIIDQNTVSPVMEGQQSSKYTTARDVIEQKNQSMIKLGLIMLGVINFEKRLAELRIYNILKNWTKEIDSKVDDVRGGVNKTYRVIGIDSEIDNGEVGKKVVEFTDETPESEQIMAEEDLMFGRTGKKVRKIYINPKALRNVKYKWKINIEPTEKNTGMLKAAKFEEMIAKIFQMFVPLGIIPNMEYLKHRLAVLNNENPGKLWDNQQQQPQQQQQGQSGPAMGGQGVGSQMMSGMEPMQMLGADKLAQASME